MLASAMTWVFPVIEKTQTTITERKMVMAAKTCVSVPVSDQDGCVVEPNYRRPRRMMALV